MTEPGQTNLRLLTVGISVVVVLTLSASTITTPLWLDSINTTDAGCHNGTNSSCITNSSTSNSTDLKHRLDNYTVLFLVNVIYLIISGAVLLVLSLCVKGAIPESNKKYPKSQFMLIGFSDAVSSIFFVYAADGSRTAPYLQSLVTNFAIPVTFIVRFVILQKRPTAWKAVFAGFVLCAEFIALVPSIFPSLESDSSKKDDGGATGIAGVLWPLCYFIGYLPQAIVIVVLEKSSKARVTSAKEDGGEELHPAYLLFWTYLFCLLGVVLLFWTNIIPDFGNTSSIHEFWEVFVFNMQCFFGAADCPSKVHIFSAVCITAMLVNRLATILFLRFTEGASYLIIIMSLQTPVVLLFWTLFDETPFIWHPHAHLSTWLSIVAMAIMMPSIYLYNRGSLRSSVASSSREHSLSINNCDQRRPLVYSTESYQSIDVSNTNINDTVFAYQNHDFHPVEPYYLESSINSSDSFT